MNFQIGDRVACNNLKDFAPHERKALEGRIGTVIDITSNYIRVRFDEDIAGLVLVKNDIPFRRDELERI